MSLQCMERHLAIRMCRARLEMRGSKRQQILVELQVKNEMVIDEDVINEQEMKKKLKKRDEEAENR